jgi:hypothetical protein
MKLTPKQKQVLAKIINATANGEWYRAASNGERVTLASLYWQGLAQRQAWRGAEGEADAAHEYKASERVIAVMREQGI